MGWALIENTTLQSLDLTCNRIHPPALFELLKGLEKNKSLSTLKVSTSNTELNDLRIIICLRKSEVAVEKNSVCNVNAKLMEHGIHCLSHAPKPMTS